jgi:predicted kinase
MEESVYSFEVKNPYNLRPTELRKFDYSKPSIIFTAGPTGSGKSGLLNKTIQLLYKNKIPPRFISFLIDDYVEGSTYYKDRINEIIEKYNCTSSVEPGSECDLVNPSNDLLEDFGKAYFDIREKGPCVNDDISKSCKQIYNEQLRDAIQSGQNIVIETTGKGIPLKYLNELLNMGVLYDYNIIFVYSIVSFDELIKRNKSRARRQLESYIENNTKPAPRLPNIRPDVFKAATSGIIDTLLILRNYCLGIGIPNTTTCGPLNNFGNFILFIFDNNMRISKLIYDSRTKDKLLSDDEFSELLLEYNLKLTGGKNKKRTKKYNKKIVKRKRSRKNKINLNKR